MPTAARIASASRATGHHAELLGRLVQEHRDSWRDRIPARWCHLGESADRPVDHVEDRAAAWRERGGALRPVARHRRYDVDSVGPVSDVASRDEQSGRLCASVAARISHAP